MDIRKYNTQPRNSIISRDLSGDIHYTDSFRIEMQNTEELSVDYLTTLLFTSVPKWVRMLLTIRDYIVKPFGLKLGKIPRPTDFDGSIYYHRGDRAIYFLVTDRSDSEIVMAEDDKHLYFRTSISIQKKAATSRQYLYLTTIVQFHNIWGRIYFVPVKPLHKLIMKRLLINFLKVLK